MFSFLKRAFPTAVSLAAVMLLAAFTLPSVQEWVIARMCPTSTPDLTADIARLQAENDELRRLHAWYREFLELRSEQPDTRLTEARVIAFDPSDTTGGFTVNAGTADGVAAGMPVLGEQGLLGVVQDCGLQWSRVRTVYHPRVSVPVMVSRTGEVCRTVGGNASARAVTVERLSHGSSAAAGDLLVTSGLGGTYPRGLPVGTVTTVQSNADGLTASGEAAVLCGTPTYVMIVTAWNGQLS